MGIDIKKGGVKKLYKDLLKTIHAHITPQITSKHPYSGSFLAKVANSVSRTAGTARFVGLWHNHISPALRYFSAPPRLCGKVFFMETLFYGEKNL